MASTVIVVIIVNFRLVVDKNPETIRILMAHVCPLKILYTFLLNIRQYSLCNQYKCHSNVNQRDNALVLFCLHLCIFRRDLSSNRFSHKNSSRNHICIPSPDLRAQLDVNIHYVTIEDYGKKYFNEYVDIFHGWTEKRARTPL